MTPAAVSYQVKEMEEQLGLQLFARNSRSMALTPAGRLLFDAAADALATLRHAVARAQRLNRRRRAAAPVAGPPLCITHWLLPRLADWRAAHPDVALTFDISDEVRDFDTDEVDIAIRFGAGAYAGTHAAPVRYASGARLQSRPAGGRRQPAAAARPRGTDAMPGGLPDR